MLSLVEDLVPKEAKIERAPSRREVKQQNEGAMADLQARLAGVSGIRAQKKPRRAR